MLFLVMGAADADIIEKNTVDKFYYNAEISSGETSLRRLELNASMVSQLTQTNAGDVRIYDANGNEMPAILRAINKKQEEKSEELSFYPLFNTSGVAREKNIKVKRDDSGNVVSVSSLSKSVKSDGNITGYIIDQLKYLPMKLSSLAFEWSQESHMQVINVKVETSDDLKSWRTVNNSAVIALLQFENNLLKQDTVEFQHATKRFIRITLKKPVSGFLLNKVTATFNSDVETDYHWISVGEMKKVEGEEPYYVFTSVGGVAAVKLKFDIKDYKGMFSGELYSFNNKKWVLRKHGISQYKIAQQEVVMESEPITINGVADKEWKFVPDNKAAFFDSALPEILFAYRRYELVFNAQGTAPYAIAWGNSEVTTQHSALAAIVKLAEENGSRIDTVNVMSSRRTDVVAKDPSDEIDWKKLILWSVLILGVLGAGRMAYSLFKEMNAVGTK